jgi:hypothetical protein
MQADPMTCPSTYLLADGQTESRISQGLATIPGTPQVSVIRRAWKQHSEQSNVPLDLVADARRQNGFDRLIVLCLTAWNIHDPKLIHLVQGAIDYQLAEISSAQWKQGSYRNDQTIAMELGNSPSLTLIARI